MMPCDTCQPQFLPYVYDLLDSDERHQLEVHLNGCPHCQVELQRCRARSVDIAAAVKQAFPDVVFKTPRPTVRTARPMPRPRAPRRPLLLQRWAMAAAVVLAVLSATGAGAWCVSYYLGTAVDEASERLAQAQKELDKTRFELDARHADAQKEILAVQAEVDKLMQDYQATDKKVRADEQKRVLFEIKGPRSVQAGALNRFDVQVKSANPQLPPQTVKDVVARVVNDKTKEVLFTKHVLQNHTFLLPRELPIRAGEPLSLELEADVDGTPALVREHLTLAMSEYVAHLATDRPMYRPGETVRFRALALERFSLTPAAEELNLRFRIVGPNQIEVFKRDVSTRLVTGKDGKQLVLGPDGRPLGGVAAGEFPLPAQLPGGVYALTVSEQNDRFPAERRSFVVHRWQQPRFNKTVDFDRASYGPGDQVTLRGKVARLGNAAGGAGPAAGVGMIAAPGGMAGDLRLNVLATVNNVNIHSEDMVVEPDGSFSVDFELPVQLVSDTGTVTLTFMDGGDRETLVRPIPIVLRDVNVHFYPEGGDLVAGVPNRVYFQAVTGTHHPADIRGRIMESTFVRTKTGQRVLGPNPREVARVQTLTDAEEPGINQGLGSFVFTPLPERAYQLRLDVPVGVKRGYDLPKTKLAGVVLHTPDAIVTDDVAVDVTSVGTDRELLIGAYCRGKLLDHAPVVARAGEKRVVKLHPAVNVGGVYRITVFEKKSQDLRYHPVAERLIFRKQTAQLHVAIRPNRYDHYVPGESAYLDLEARDEKSRIVPAVALVAVIDSSVLKLANDKSARSMPTHFLLTTEIRRPEDLENADALLGEHRHAARALDLLLGTQGWRRFAEQDPTTFAQKSRDDAVRARHILSASQPTAKLGDSERTTRDKLDKQFVGKFVTLQKELGEKERLEYPPAAQQRHNVAQSNVNGAAQLLAAQQERRDSLWNFYFHSACGIGVALLVFLAFCLVSGSLYRLAEGKRGFIVLGAGVCLLAGLFMISVVGTFAMIGVDTDMGIFGRRGFGPRAMKAPMATQAQPQQGGMVVAPLNLPPDAKFPIVRDLPREDRIEQADAPQAAGNGMPGAGAMPGIIPMGQMPGQPAFINQERQLRQLGRYEQILFNKLGRQVAVPAALDPSVVREYAHRHKASAGQPRKDFAETVYWQPALVLQDGQGKVQFDLSDAVTNYRVLVVSHTLDGRLGADVIDLAARLPYQVEPKVPVEISSSDRLTLPILLSNNSSDPTNVSVNVLRHDNLSLKGVQGNGLSLAAGQTKRYLAQFQPAVQSGKAVVRVEGRFAKGTDTVERSFTIVPDGFPAGGAVSGTLHGPVAALHDIEMPKDWIDGSLTLQVQAYPSVLTDLQQGLDALLREPHGCFEQSSSSTYPNVLILNYLQDTKQANPALEKRVRGLLDRGYNQLLGFECIAPDNARVRRGYEWFGQTAPPHEALTAYGLLEFTDMARVYPVDSAMVQRTRQYLLDQRDGQGGFKRNARAVDRFGQAPADVTNAYIVWSLVESGAAKEVDRELTALAEQAKKSQDPYFLALVGLGELGAGRTDKAVEVLQRLREFQKPSGAVEGARTSITRSAGRDLDIETTALAALGWQRAARPVDFNDATHKAGRWLFAQRGSTGGFGSTQATVLALKALIEFSKANRGAVERGVLRLEIARPEIGVLHDEAQLIPGRTEAVTIAFKEKPGNDSNAPLKVLQPGKNEVQVRLDAGNTQIPYTLSWTYRTVKQAEAEKPPVRLTTRLSQPQLKEGQSLKLKATLENVSGADQGMAVAVIGLPAGLTLPEDFTQLKELARLQGDGTRPGVISAWELQGRELVLYWRDLKADAKIEVDLDLVARLPGTYSGPASRAYLYYDADRKHWVDPLHVTIGLAQ